MRRAIVTVVALAALAGSAAGGQIETVDARVIRGQVVSIGPAGAVVKAGGKQQTVALGDISRIALVPAADAMAKPGGAVVTTAAGGLLPVGALSMSDGKLALTTAAFGQVTLALSGARMIYLPGEGMTAACIAGKIAEMKIPAGQIDVVVVAGGEGNWLTVTGVLKAIDQEAVIFRWKQTDRKIDRAKVLGVRLASVRAGRAPAAFAQAADGTRIAVSTVKLEGDTASMTAVQFGKLTCPRRLLAGVSFRSDRVVELSALKPAAVKQYGFFDKVFNYRVNRSVGGGPLKLGQTTYATGLGLHSFCQLTYDLSAGYSRFVAVVGIDRAVYPAGDAELTILGDGRILSGPLRLTGKDAPKTLRLDVAGVKRLTIRVEFGRDKLDVADHVDLAAARLIK